MLRDNFYSINNVEIKDRLNIKYTISFNDKHEVFLSHFPNNPIVPGACIIEIIRELISKAFNTSLNINFIKSVKFLNIIIPNSNQEIIFDISLSENNNNYLVNVSIYSSEVVYSKINLQLTNV
ncbi:MAG: 3-hydroxyacyl-ACP dehydratase [Bacteroidetes bacterium]|nr:3-hydroxyacyl-ACP dehydratase [Bacteroidota bacterium]